MQQWWYISFASLSVDDKTVASTGIEGQLSCIIWDGVVFRMDCIKTVEIVSDEESIDFRMRPPPSKKLRHCLIWEIREDILQISFLIPKSYYCRG